MRRLTWMAAALAGGLLIAGCGAGSGPEPAGGDAGGTVATGVADASGTADGNGSGAALTELTAVVPTDSSYGSLDPVRNGGNTYIDQSLMAAIYGYLVYIDDQGDVQYDMAESLAFEDDPAVWTLTIKPDLNFSDGEPLDAEAVVFNLSRLADPELASYFLSNFQGVKAEAADDVTVTITLPEGNASFDRVMAGVPGMMASPKAVEADPEEFGRKPVGAGPYTLREWVAGSSMALTKNPDYYRADEVTIEDLRYQVLADPTQAINLVKTGEADIGFSVNRKAADQAVAAGMESTQAALAGYYGITLNFRSAPFDDIRARQAVAYALDTGALAKVIDGENGTAATSIFPPGSPYAVDALPETNKPEQAQRLFDELAAEGKQVEFRVLATVQEQQFAEAIQSQLSAYENVTVTVDAREPSSYTPALMVDLDWEAVLRYNGFGDPEPRFYDFFATGGTQNNAGFSNAEADALLDEARLMAGTDRAEALQQVQQLSADEVQIISFANASTWLYHREGLNLPIVNYFTVLFAQVTSS